MTRANSSTKKGTSGAEGEPSLEHFYLVLVHRKWVIVPIFILISVATAIFSYRLPDIYSAYTLVLVDPQQVPENYVQPTVTGNIGNRLGSLTQQIMSATRLQRIIDNFNLYAEERETLPREDVISGMRRDISVNVVSNFRGASALQAFQITYRGKDPQLVAQVTNELASLFIEENLKARERVATGTNEFLEHRLEAMRNTLLDQENRLKAFKLQHVGEMPEHQGANIQILNQLQSRLQGLTDSVNRAQQQKTYLHAALESRREAAEARKAQADQAEAPELEAALPPEEELPTGPTAEDIRDAAQLRVLLSRYGESHPDVQRLKREVEDRRLLREQLMEQAKERAALAAKLRSEREQEQPKEEPVAAPEEEFPEVAQLDLLDEEIARSREQQEQVLEAISRTQARIEAVPVREQEITELVRDYNISRNNYQSLLSKKLEAETGTDLEIRQKGERFTILDPAQVPERPSGPNRLKINFTGSAFGLVLGVALAFLPEFLGSSITLAEQVTAYSGVPVLGVIPTIRTRVDRQRRRRWIIAGAASGVATILLGFSLLLYHFRDRIF